MTENIQSGSLNSSTNLDCPFLRLLWYSFGRLSLQQCCEAFPTHRWLLFTIQNVQPTWSEWKTSGNAIKYLAHHCNKGLDGIAWPVFDVLSGVLFHIQLLSSFLSLAELSNRRELLQKKKKSSQHWEDRVYKIGIGDADGKSLYPICLLQWSQRSHRYQQKANMLH